MQAGGGLLEAADHAQGRRLAAAGRTEQAEELAVLDLEVDVVDGDHVAERLRHLDEADVDRPGHGALRGSRRACHRDAAGARLHADPVLALMRRTAHPVTGCAER